MKISLSTNSLFKSGGFAALLATVIIATIILIVVSSLSLVTIIEQKITKNIAYSIQAYYAAESGIEDSLYRIIKGLDYSATNNLIVGSSSADINISGVGTQKNILVRGQNGNRFRSLAVNLDVADSQSASFYYGVQVGEGGLVMDNNSRVTGSVYSNGPIQGGQGATITGDAWVANEPLYSNQQSLTNNSDFIFGQADPEIDAAQSFIPSTSQNLIKVSLLFKKSGAPPNKTVRLLTDNSGQPSKTLVSADAFGTIDINQLNDASYTWIDVMMNAPVALQSGVKYWVSIDSLADQNNYLFWAKDTTDGYSGGTGKYSADWNAGFPVWANANGDLAFKAWLSRPNNVLNKVVVGAQAHANTINNSTVTGDAYFQTIIDTTVGGTSYPESEDPTAEEMPVSQEMIDTWKTQAANGGVINGDYVVDGGEIRTLGPKKIIGNLIISNAGDLTVSGVIYVTGDIDISNNAHVRLSPELGGYGSVIMTDGFISVSNGCHFHGGPNDSYILILSTKSGDAVDIANNSEAAIFYASNGAINIDNNATLKEVTAYQLRLRNGAQVIYEGGLASAKFSSGVSGACQITSWQEVP